MSFRPVRSSLAAGPSIAALLTLAACRAETASQVTLVAGDVGSALEGRDSLVMAFPLRNDGTGRVEALQVASIRLEGATLASSTRLPLSLGPLGPRGAATVFATLVGPLTAGSTYTMSVGGTFTEGGRSRPFNVSRSLRVPPASPGSAEAATSSSAANRVSGGRFPPQRPSFEQANDDHAWRVPTGRARPSPERPSETRAQPAPRGDPPGIDFFINAPLGITGSTTAEPSGGVTDSIVFATANWYAAYSTNSGAAFTRVDPTTVFPNADGGFCCDQIAIYAPSIDRMIWLLQYSQATDSLGNVRNRYRLAAASPAALVSSGATSWTYWDITSTQLGITSGWLDYPDLSLGDSSLYLGFDQVGSGHITIRMPLAEIRSGSTIHFWYTSASNGALAYGDHLCQTTGDEIFWAGHNTSSSLRVFSWKEGSTTYFWRDVSIGSWNNGTLSSLTPDGVDWLTKLENFPRHAVLGATRLRRSAAGQRIDHIRFAWTASSGGGYAQAQVQWVELDRGNNFSVVAQQSVWNSAYAFAYAALGVNADGEVGMALEYGGPGDYESHVDGFWGDYIVYITAASDVGTTRYGDYVTIRPDASHPRRFDAFGYALRKATPPATGTVPDTHYIQFGRP